MTTTTPTEAVAETVQQLPIEAIVPDPANRKVVLDAQFVASVRTHGVLQPLLVTRHAAEEGRFHLVAGHRRLGAAAKVGLATVPALVRTLSEQEKLELALVDNLQRQDLSPTEEAVAMARLVEFGMSAPKLAKRIGRSASYVRERLKLLELPAAARRLVDDGTLGIEQGLTLVALVDHPEALDHVVAEIAAGSRNVEWIVSSTLRQIATDAKVAEGRAKAEEKGLRVVDHEGYTPSTYTELSGHRGLDVDAKAHAKEPCHAVVIEPRNGALTPVCTDKRRHARRGASAVKSAPKAGADAEARAEKAARKEAAEHRREFLTALLAGRVTKADVLRVVLPNYLEDANSNEQAAVARLLGVEAEPGNRYDRWSEALSAYAAISEANLLRACLAFSLAQGEEALDGGWAYERVQRHGAFLADKGYEPTAYEAEQAAERERRHAEHQAEVEAARQFLATEGEGDVEGDVDDGNAEEVITEDAS